MRVSTLSLWLKTHCFSALIALLLIYIPTSIFMVARSIERSNLIAKLDSEFVGEVLIKYAIPSVSFETVRESVQEDGIQGIVYQKLTSYPNAKIMYFSKTNHIDIPLIYGRLFNRDDFFTAPKRAVVGASVYDELKTEYKGEPKQLDLGGMLYEVIGVIAPQPLKEINSLIWINEIPESELSRMDEYFYFDCLDVNDTLKIDALCKRIAQENSVSAHVILTETPALIRVFPLIQANRWSAFVAASSFILLIISLHIWSMEQRPKYRVLLLLGASRAVVLKQGVITVSKTIIPAILLSTTLNIIWFPQYVYLLLVMLVLLAAFCYLVLLCQRSVPSFTAEENAVWITE